MLYHRTLGVLGGMGPAATANFLQLLVHEFNSKGVYTDSAFPRMIIFSIPLEDWDNKGARDKIRVAEQVLTGLDWLKAAGADILAVPCNTVHEFIDDPMVVNIIDETLKLCNTSAKLGIMCSRQTREAGLYERNNHNVTYYTNQDTLDAIIGSVMAGIDCDIGPMINAGFPDCKTIVLGCTELSLCAYTHATRHDIVDSTSVLAKAVVRRMVR